MNRNKLKAYAPKARRDFIKAVTDRAAVYGLTKDKIEPVEVKDDVAIIGGKDFPREVVEKRKRLEERIAREGFEQVMEAMAYTWFNRLVAIRYMEVHGYLDHGYRVLSTTADEHPEREPGSTPVRQVPTPVKHKRQGFTGQAGQAGQANYRIGREGKPFGWQGGNRDDVQH